ncbi:pre-toxin TG domain-containing protein [Priestia megaterium]|uniref:pre-toxin TG domain-containing protein n=1 Tax=Priestia megaterium TaxID=1404 RepID=UPI002E249F4C|nr:pre-toxin TG domain-containing protein [Priestia megaterium]
MRKILSIILIAVLLSFCNLPNYIQDNKAEAATYEFTGDFQKDVETLKALIAEYKELDSSSKSSITIKVQKAQILAKITAKIKEIKDEYTQLANSVNRAVNETVKTFKMIDEALDSSIAIVNDMNKTVDEMNQTLNQMVKTQNEMIKTQNEMIQQTKDAAKTLNEMNAAMADANKALDTMNSGIRQVNSSIDGANKAMVQFNKDLQATNKSLDQVVGGIDKANAGMKTMVSSINKANTAINNANKAMDTMNRSVDTVNSYFTKVDKSLDRVNSVVYPNKENININAEMSKIAKSLNAIKKIQSQQIIDVKVVNHVEDLNKDLAKVKQATSLIADFMPLIANIKALNDSSTGKDLITRKDLSSMDRTISGLGILGGGMVKAVNTTNKTLNTASKLGSKASTKYARVPAVIPEKSFNSFSTLKTHMGPAGKTYGRDNQWHHIVEQNQEKYSGFTKRDINKVSNIVAVPTSGDNSVHKKISALYSSKQPYSQGKRVREWLQGKSYEEQFDFGMKELKKYGTVTPTSKGWVFEPFKEYR